MCTSWFAFTYLAFFMLKFSGGAWNLLSEYQCFSCRCIWVCELSQGLQNEPHLRPEYGTAVRVFLFETLVSSFCFFRTHPHNLNAQLRHTHIRTHTACSCAHLIIYDNWRVYQIKTKGVEYDKCELPKSREKILSGIEIRGACKLDWIEFKSISSVAFSHESLA